MQHARRGSGAGVLVRVTLAAFGLVACGLLWSGPLEALSRGVPAGVAPAPGPGSPGLVSDEETPAAVSTVASPVPAAEIVPVPLDQPGITAAPAPVALAPAGVVMPAPGVEPRVAPDVDPGDGVALGANEALPVGGGSVGQVITVIVPPHDTGSPTTTTTAPGKGTSGGVSRGELGLGPSGSTSAGRGPSGAANGAFLPPTGLDPSTLRLLVLSLILVDLGWLCTSLARRRTRRGRAA